MTNASLFAPPISRLGEVLPVTVSHTPLPVLKRPFKRTSPDSFGLDLLVTPVEYWSFQEALWPFVEDLADLAMSYEFDPREDGRFGLFQVEVAWESRGPEVHAALSAVLARINEG